MNENKHILNCLVLKRSEDMLRKYNDSNLYYCFNKAEVEALEAKLAEADNFVTQGYSIKQSRHMQHGTAFDVPSDSIYHEVRDSGYIHRAVPMQIVYTLFKDTK